MASPDTIEIMLADKPGKRVKVPYTANEPIYNIIRRISMELQESKAEYNYQELYLGGFHLEYPQLPLDNYRVLGGTLTYQSIKKGDMSVFVKTLTVKTLCISCNSSDTILALKKIIFKREGVPLVEIKLQYKGKVLDNEDTLESRGINRLSTLTMSTLVRGGLNMNLSAPKKFADVSNSANVSAVKLVTGAPPGWIVRPGTNIEAKCPCTPKYHVICPIHFGTIELSQQKFECPNCGNAEQTVPVTVGFLTSKYRFLGLKADDTQFSASWTYAQKEDLYQFFNPKKQIGWARLVIQSAPLDEEDDCPLCLKRMVDKIKTFGCGHRYHESCSVSLNLDTCSDCDYQDILVKGKTFSGGLRLRLSH